MRVEEVELGAIADSVGTPFYCYSARAIMRAVARWREAFGAHGFDGSRHRVCFAVKANSALAVLRQLQVAGCGFDVVSGGELERVLVIGGEPGQVVFSGPGKGVDDLRRAVAARVGLINVEVPGELVRLRELARALERRLAVGLRLNPDLDPRTHPAIATGPRTTKFGLAPEEIDELIERGSFGDELEVRAIAVHIGSQVMTLEPMAAAASQALDWARRLRASGQPLEWIDIGGGLAIPYGDDHDVPTPEAFAASIGNELASWDGGLITEPGRVIVGPAGWLVTRVRAVRLRGARGLLVCDAGMNALLRPALYGARHRVHALGGGGGARVWDVVGPLCEAGDVLARDVKLGDVEVGCLLAVGDVGAYGFVMASEYNTHPRPAQVWIDGDRWATITPRLSYQEMLAGEKLAPWQKPVPA